MATTPAGASAAAIAMNRFGLGARADESAPTEPKTWLLDQFRRYTPSSDVFAEATDSASALHRYVELTSAARVDNSADKLAADDKRRKESLLQLRADVEMRTLSALTTPTPFAERLVHFWSNHFAVSINKPALVTLAGPFEREAIRPNIFGSFESMVLAAERHPAMQLFLDQTRSTGPNSAAAERVNRRRQDRKLGINENLAREIMELHTLGVRSGYSQDDVTQFAFAMSGWSVGRNDGPGSTGEPAGRFLFRDNLHEPGTRTILGKRYGQQGVAQPLAVLHDLSTSSAAAQFIATKLARHFIADDPPVAAVERLKAAFMRSNGDLPTVYRALVDAPESWTLPNVKFKTPWEWTVSSMRGLGMRDLGRLPVQQLLAQLGQPTWRPGSPAGYDDIAAQWAAPDALVRRVEVAQRLAARVSGVDPQPLATRLMPGVIAEPTLDEIGRAESQRTGLALLLVSADFLRR
ncbi:DUF1800 family protein [soil metagenome]